MKRLLVALLVALIAAALSSPVVAASGAPSQGPGPSVQATRAPKVVLIVGPVGGTTDRYRALAAEAADVARRYTANVVEVYSPDATWPAVREALDGASIVVYLGHGNGWPSRYRDSLFPATQNGFGLNPVAGVDDDAHQYFGESSLDEVTLAPDAVVLLHHLCYASGNTEPGLPEGTRDQAAQRVDNYAAGFIRAGARAVVAEGHFEPAWYLTQLLTSRRSIEAIWRSAPSRNGHEQAFASARSPGYTARLDPDRPGGGYFRSLVTKGTLNASAVRGSGTGALVAATVPAQPSLVDLGLVLGMPVFSRLPVAGVASDLSLPVADGRAAELPKDLQVGIRWDPLDVGASPGTDRAGGGTGPEQPADSSAGTPPAPPVGSGSPDPLASPIGGGSADPAASPAAAPAAGPGDPPEVSLVVAERPGAVVETHAARFTKTRVAVRVTFPATPGLYRLVPTLHLGDGVAYDAATQALLTPVLVRVSGPVSAAYGVAPAIGAVTGLPFELSVRVANTGLEGWGTMVDSIARGMTGQADRPMARRVPARLVASWVSSTGAAVPAATDTSIADAGSRAGGQAVVTLRLTAPLEFGSYLLVLDVASPVHGALSALGSAPAIVRVTVEEPPPRVPQPPVLQPGA